MSDTRRDKVTARRKRPGAVAKRQKRVAAKLQLLQCNRCGSPMARMTSSTSGRDVQTCRRCLSEGPLSPTISDLFKK